MSKIIRITALLLAAGFLTAFTVSCGLLTLTDQVTKDVKNSETKPAVTQAATSPAPETKPAETENAASPVTQAATLPAVETEPAVTEPTPADERYKYISIGYAPGAMDFPSISLVTRNGHGDVVSVKWIDLYENPNDPKEYIEYYDHEYRYDSRGNVIYHTETHSNGAKNVWTYNYDADGRITYESYNNSKLFYNYDGTGRLIGKTLQENGTTVYSSDGWKREDGYYLEKTEKFSYDRFGNRLHGDKTQSVLYNSDNKVVKEIYTDSVNRITRECEYYSNGQLAKDYFVAEEKDGGCYSYDETFTYDEKGRLTSYYYGFDGPPSSDYEFSYNKDGRKCFIRDWKTYEVLFTGDDSCLGNSGRVRIEREGSNFAVYVRGDYIRVSPDGMPLYAQIFDIYEATYIYDENGRFITAALTQEEEKG